MDQLLPVLQRNARGIVLDERDGSPVPDVVLIKRTRPGGMPPYWVMPGGGVEPDDPTLEDAMRREVSEELGATVGPAVPVLVDTEPTTGADGTAGVKVQVFFACRLRTLDPALRHGPEVDAPVGSYEIVRVPFSRAGLGSVDLVPVAARRYLQQNLEGVLSLLDAVGPERPCGGR
ncbi:NUDIX hydrolase [Mangrovactinospora gilvigrisea]|uniref:NUDIX hydrolase n=1 Tax=Mangrovactinospora gilvigrisea TaxID=1428644 RepID=A0A1J7BYD6_9ACTN|nr:NUDIX hydrolase [Mangrovactinospora gilvigrisea]OIV38489.1 NUDIX hydrolase [Mangrovactinospora gilvigrisea]